MALEAITGNEGLDIYHSNVFTADLGPSRLVSALYRITQPFYPGLSPLVSQMLGDHYVPREYVMASALPGFISESVSGLPDTLREDPTLRAKRFTKYALRKYPIAATPQLVYDKMAKHGRQMIERRSNILRDLGYRTDLNYLIPIQQHIYPVLGGGNSVVYDVNDNPGTRLYVDPVGIGRDMKKYSRGQRILSFSLEVGNMEAYSIFREPDPDDPTHIIDVDPYIKFVDAFDEQKAYDNVKKLNDMVQSLDIDLAVVALGNDNGTVVNAVSQLRSEGLWDESKIIFAAEAMPVQIDKPDANGNVEKIWTHRSWYGSYGPPEDTVFVINHNIARRNKSYGYGASTAVVTTSIIADFHSKNGVPGNRLKEKTLECTEFIYDEAGRPMNLIRDMDPVRRVVYAN